MSRAGSVKGAGVRRREPPGFRSPYTGPGGCGPVPSTVHQKPATGGMRLLFLRYVEISGWQGACARPAYRAWTQAGACLSGQRWPAMPRWCGVSCYILVATEGVVPEPGRRGAGLDLQGILCLLQGAPKRTKEKEEQEEKKKGASNPGWASRAAAPASAAASAVGGRWAEGREDDGPGDDSVRCQGSGRACRGDGPRCWPGGSGGRDGAG